MSSDSEKMKGTAKEMAGKVTGSDELANEGQAQQEKAEKTEQATEKMKEAQSAEDKEQAHQ